MPRGLGLPPISARSSIPLNAQWLMAGAGAAGAQGSSDGWGGSGGGGAVREGFNWSPVRGLVNIHIGQGGIAPTLNLAGGNGGATSVTQLGITMPGGFGGAANTPSAWGNGGTSGSGFPGDAQTYGGGNGGPAVGTNPGPGGHSSITGSDVEYGRGGGTGLLTPGSGGSGGLAFVANAQNGVNGIFIARYSGPLAALGGRVSYIGNDVLHTFDQPGDWILQIF